MRAVVQRVRDCVVRVNGVVTGSIDAGLLVYLGVARNDVERDADSLCDKIAHLRIFPDQAGKMNKSVLEAGGSVLVVSQFTLLGDARDGRRPSYAAAADPAMARALYERALCAFAAKGLTVASGEFQAVMEVSAVNMGPVTILLDSEKRF